MKKRARTRRLYQSQSGKFAFAAPTGTPPHILAFAFKELAGVDFTVALYKGGGPAMTDFFGNQIQAIFQATTIVPAAVGDKRVRILGIAAQERSPLLPDVPTLAEQGLPAAGRGFLERAQRAAGTASDIVRRLNHEVNEALKSAELKATYAKLGITANIVSPEQFGVFMKEETVRWDALVKASKLPKVR